MLCFPHSHCFLSLSHRWWPLLSVQTYQAILQRLFTFFLDTFNLLFQSGPVAFLANLQYNFHRPGNSLCLFSVLLPTFSFLRNGAWEASSGRPTISKNVFLTASSWLVIWLWLEVKAGNCFSSGFWRCCSSVSEFPVLLWKMGCHSASQSFGKTCFFFPEALGASLYSWCSELDSDVS